MAKKKRTAVKKRRTSKGNSTVGKIARKAKSIRKSGEKWTSAIKRASKMI